MYSVTLIDQYTGQIILETIRVGRPQNVTDRQSYGIPISEHVFEVYIKLYSLNVTIDYDAANVTQSLIDSATHSAELVYEMINEPTNEALSGILWLFPAAVSRLFVAG